MKKEILPIVVIVGSLCLLGFNIATSEDYDKGFWFRNTSSVLLIVAMILTIRSQRKQTENKSEN